MVEQWWILLSLGLVVGALGTLIGVGGGFLMVPVLIFLFPNENTDTITSISFFVVFLSAASGSAAYFKMGRIDLKATKWFAIAAAPGAVLGAFGTEWFPRDKFDVVFALILLAAAVYLFLKPDKSQDENSEPKDGYVTRKITEKEGTRHVYHFSRKLGVGLSGVVGIVASLLGVGGGFIFVPLLNRTLNFPVRIATATSQMIVGFMSLTGTIVHLSLGHLHGHLGTVALLGAGAIGGAQIGAPLSNRFHGKGLIRILAITLALVGVRILIKSFGHHS